LQVIFFFAVFQPSYLVHFLFLQSFYVPPSLVTIRYGKTRIKLGENYSDIYKYADCFMFLFVDFPLSNILLCTSFSGSLNLSLPHSAGVMSVNGIQNMLDGQ